MGAVITAPLFLYYNDKDTDSYGLVKIMRLLCSTGALIGRPNGRNYRLLEELVPKLNCDGLEFMLYSDWYDEIEVLTDYLKGLNVPIPVIHCQKTVGEFISNGEDDEAYKRFEINAALASDIGAEKMVMHLWNGMVSDSKFERNLAAYPKLKKIADSYGVDLLIENVLCNVSTPFKRWEQLRSAYPDIHFIFDTKMAKFHDEYKKLIYPEYEWLFSENHIKHYHVNDYGGGYMTWEDLRVLPVGAGNIDFKPFFDRIAKIGYDDTMTVEATAVRKDGTVDTDMLNKCFEDIRRLTDEAYRNIRK